MEPNDIEQSEEGGLLKIQGLITRLAVGVQYPRDIEVLIPAIEISIGCPMYRGCSRLC